MKFARCVEKLHLNFTQFVIVVFKMVSIVPFTGFLIFGSFFIKTANAVECYVCRGCETVTPDQVQTCEASNPVTDEPEFTTNYAGLLRQEPALPRSISNVLWLENAEGAEEIEKGVIDDSKLPGDDKVPGRSILQVDDGDDSRCVIAVFEENGVTDVVRGCSTASDNSELRCSEAISDHFSGSLLYCDLCAEDLCNSASKSSVALLVLLISALTNLTLLQ